MSIVESAVNRAKKLHASDRQTRPAQRQQDDAANLRDEGFALPAPIQWPAGDQRGRLEIEHLREAGFYAPAAGEHRSQEEFRGIRRAVLEASLRTVGTGEQQVGPIVVVTSAMPGDGKSYTALNLAMSIAEDGVHDVLLVDADTIKHTISTACELRGKPGLMELLARPEANFFDYAYPTSLRRLHVLPAGSRTDSRNNLISAARIGPLFESIRRAMSDHFVIIDTPPILLSGDTPLLTDVAGQVLLVVRSGKSSHDAVKEAVGHIRETIPVGVVLNGWSPLLPSERKSYSAFMDYVK